MNLDIPCHCQRMAMFYPLVLLIMTELLVRTWDATAYSNGLGRIGARREYVMVLVLSMLELAAKDGNFGHVCMYQWSGASWDQRGSNIDGEAANDKIGWSVPLSSDGGILASPLPMEPRCLLGYNQVEVDIDISGNVYLSGDRSTFAIGTYLCHWHPLE